MDRKKVIILEGPDGGGKTTLATWLKREHGFSYVHAGPPTEPADMLAEYGAQLWKALHGRKNVVFDRLHLGELVYGPVLRDCDGLGYYGRRLLERVLNATSTPCYVCLPPWDVCCANWKSTRARLMICCDSS